MKSSLRSCPSVIALFFFKKKKKKKKKRPAFLIVSSTDIAQRKVIGSGGTISGLSRFPTSRWYTNLHSITTASLLPLRLCHSSADSMHFIGAAQTFQLQIEPLSYDSPPEARMTTIWSQGSQISLRLFSSLGVDVRDTEAS